MKKVVITGATSFIGVHLIKEWLKESCEIFAVVRPNSRHIDRLPQDDKIHIIEREMTGYDSLSADIKEADCFYHLAWEGARAPYRDDKIMQEKNYISTLKAFDSAIRMGCTFFLGSGSQAEYGMTNGAVNETYPCHPNTEYGREKLHAFQTLAAKIEGGNIHFVWIRIFSIYGTYDYPKTLVMSALGQMQKNKPVEMTPCTQLWDYLHVEDVARAMKRFAFSDCENGIYNVASGDYKPLKEFVEIIKDVTGSQSELRFGAVAYGPNGPVNLTPDVTKIKNALRWEPEISFEEGIRKMINNKCMFGGGGNTLVTVVCVVHLDEWWCAA